MQASDSLFSGVVDYAGIFPPAALSLDSAVYNYSAYLGTSDSWMLGRFVCPANRLHELLPHLGLFTSSRPCRLTVLVGGEARDLGFLPALDADLKRINSFLDEAAGAFQVDSVECKLPLDDLGRDVPVEQFLNRLSHALQSYFKRKVTAFLEVPPTDASTTGPGRWAPFLASAIRENSNDVQLAAKLRCGGPVGATIPEIRQLARTIYSFAEHRIFWKATAGLHHPFRTRIAGTGDVMHGFVNLLIGSVLTYSKKLALPELEALIAEEEPERFVVGDGGLAWRGVRANNEEVVRARREFILSFGSCSFEEPRDELRAAGMIP